MCVCVSVASVRFPIFGTCSSAVSARFQCKIKTKVDSRDASQLLLLLSFFHSSSLRVSASAPLQFLLAEPFSGFSTGAVYLFRVVRFFSILFRSFKKTSLSLSLSLSHTHTHSPFSFYRRVWRRGGSKHPSHRPPVQSNSIRWYNSSLK